MKDERIHRTLRNRVHAKTKNMKILFTWIMTMASSWIIYIGFAQDKLLVFLLAHAGSYGRIRMRNL